MLPGQKLVGPEIVEGCSGTPINVILAVLFAVTALLQTTGAVPLDKLVIVTVVIPAFDNVPVVNVATFEALTVMFAVTFAAVFDPERL
jgi:hypothetical protein